jgi:serine/threonine-protein kinase
MSPDEPDDSLVDQLLAAAFAPAPGAKGAGGADGRDAPPRAALVEISPRYRLEDEIGRGGVGIVLRGRDVELNRDVAIKILRPEHRDHAGLTLRFVEEAQIGGQLEHPGVVPVHDMGRTADGRPFFAMKLVQGRTLAEQLRARADAKEERARWLAVFEQVCQTVAYAHARGVIHRDLKPANVILGSFGEVQVADWGLAKVVGRPEAETRATPSAASAPTAILSPGAVSTARSPSSQLLSQAGAVLGTLAYMPPEQALGRNDEVDARSDVFALGAMLCEILTGAPPYHGDAGDVLEQAREAALGPARERLRQCGADAELVELAERCLAAERDARPRGADELAKALARWRASQEKRAHDAELEAAAALARAKHERRVRKLTVALAATIVLASLAGGGVWLQRQSEERARLESAARPVREEIARARELAATARRERADAVEPRRAALAAADGAVAAASAGNPGPELREQASALRVELAAELARAEEAVATRARDVATLERMQFLVGKMGVWPWDELDAAFAQAFREWGLDFAAMTDEQIVARLRAASDPVDFCDFMLAWMGAQAGAIGGNQAPRDFERMVPVMQAADPDPWRMRIRDAIPFDVKSLAEMADDARIWELEPRTIAFLGAMLGRFQRDDHAGAIRLLRTAADRFPQEFLIRLDLSSWLLEAREYDEALAHATAAMTIAPDSTSPWLLIGAARDGVGDFEGAIAAFERALVLDPKSPDGHQGKALAELRAGRVEAAIATLRTALERQPRSDDLRYSLAFAQLQAGDVAAARTTLTGMVKTPEDLAGVPLAADLLVAIGEAPAAEAELRDTLKRTRRTTPLEVILSLRTALAASLEAAGRFEEAIAEIQITQQLLASSDRVAWISRLRALHDLADALDDFESGAREPADAVEATTVARLLDLRGPSTFSAQLWSDALDLDEAAVLRAEPLARLRAARAAIASGERAAALAQLRAEVRSQVEGAARGSTASGRGRLELLLIDPALLPVRDPARRAALPKEEAATWEAFFSEVRRLVGRVRG